MAALLARLDLWPVRALWFVLPALVGFGLGDGLAEVSDDVGLTVEVGAWAVWFVGLVALLAPSTAGLTALRTVSPLAAIGPLAVATLTGTWTGASVGAIGAGMIVAAVTFLPLVGDRMVNGSAYGPERRMALRPPAPLMLGPVQLLWVLTVAGPVLGPLLVASGRPIVGGIVTVVGLGLAWLGVQRLHQLSRRWVVFVPAGFVLHDHYALAESLLMQRPGIASLGPVPLDKGELLDLTAGSRGVALLVEFVDDTPLALRAKNEVQGLTVRRITFTPTLPGELLREARIRGIKIGVPD